MHAYLSGYDFGYTWPWTHGHLVLACALAAAALLSRKWLWPWGSAVLFALAAWAIAGFLIVQLVFGFNRMLPMPTPRFLASGQGRVLDLGCGSGRATLMVGLARPAVQLSALDNFSAEYIRDNGEDLLRRNLRSGGIESRVQIVRADMRQIPASDGEFDGVVSTYAIDHLNREGSRRTLSEVSRVLKPGGEFLMMIIRADAWLKAAYGPLLIHQRRVGPGFWPGMLQDAGLRVIEEGVSPGSEYFLCRKE